jgi:hypothetical protein
MARLGPTAGFGSVLCGSFRESEELLDAKRTGNRFRSAVEWFVNIEPNTDQPEIERFTQTYGLLRWNWTHEGQGGGASDQFEMPVSAFKESQQQLREHWERAKDPRARRAVVQWLSQQLGKESPVRQVHSAEQMWKLSQPRIGIKIDIGLAGKDSGIEINLVLGDLWQAMCCELLDLLVRRHGAIRVCSNDLCKQPYFIPRGKQKKFCSQECGKRASDRNSVRERRSKLKREKRHKH